MGRKERKDINTKFQKIIDDEPKVERKEITQLEINEAILKMKITNLEIDQVGK